MNTWAVSTFWLSWIVLLWFLMYKYLFEYTLLIIWGIHLGVKNAASNGHSIFNLLRNHQMIFHIAAPFHTLVSNEKEFQRLHIFANIIFLLLKKFTLPSEYEMISHLIFIFLILWASFHMFVHHLYISLQKHLFKTFAQFLTVFLLLSWKRSLFSDKILTSYDLQIVYSIPWIVFSLFWSTCHYVFDVISKKPLLYPML